MDSLAIKNTLLNKALLLSTITLLAACEQRYTLAPVVESNWRAQKTQDKTYRVHAGETLYSIAFRYDMDYRQLAAINHIQSPYRLLVGQVLNLKPTHVLPHPTQRSSTHYYPSAPSGVWLWPARGRLLASFLPQFGKKGIDISGQRNQPIHASASGTVAYAGDGLIGYGNLILIKHEHEFISAYAYNTRNLVHVGQKVQAGQTIAIMGMNHQHRYAVHFEIRKAGQPVNPAYYLRR